MKPISVALYTAANGREALSIDGELATLQALVGGWIEALAMPDGLTLVCNEEGRLQDLQPHHAVLLASGVPQVIVGDFFVCRTTGSNFAGLRPGDLVLLDQYVRPMA